MNTILLACMATVWMSATPSASEDKVTLRLNDTEAGDADSSIRYMFTRKEADGSSTTVANSKSPECVITLSAESAGLYTGRIVITRPGSSSAAAAVNTLALGCVNSDRGREFLCVPFDQCSATGEAGIPVSDLLCTRFLTAGDRLHVYQSGRDCRRYCSWVLNGQCQWVPCAGTVIGTSGAAAVSPGSAESTIIKCGSVFMLERSNPSRPIWFVGQHHDESSTIVAMAGTEVSPRRTLLTCSLPGGLDLNDASFFSVTGGENDRIVVLSADGDPEVFIPGTRQEGEEVVPGARMVWGRAVGTGSVIPFGAVFWYESSGGQAIFTNVTASPYDSKIDEIENGIVVLDCTGGQYADCTLFSGKERYALIWIGNGGGFNGLSARGCVTDADVKVLAVASPTEVSDERYLVFQLEPELLKSLPPGQLAFICLDTRDEGGVPSVSGDLVNATALMKNTKDGRQTFDFDEGFTGMFVKSADYPMERDWTPSVLDPIAISSIRLVDGTVKLAVSNMDACAEYSVIASEIPNGEGKTLAAKRDGERLIFSAPPSGQQFYKVVGRHRFGPVDK